MPRNQRVHYRYKDRFRLVPGIILALFLLITGYKASAQLHALTFTTTEGLPSNECYGVCQDSRGRIWLGTENGLSYLEDGMFRSNPKWGTLPLQVVRIFPMKDSGVIVVGNNPCGIFEVQKSGSVRPWAIPENQGMFYRAEMTFDQGALYLFLGRHVLRVSGNEFDTVMIQNNPGPVLSTINTYDKPVQYVYAQDTMTFGKNGFEKIRNSGKGEVWYHGNVEGLYRRQDDTCINVSRILNMEGIQFTYVFLDKHRNVWLSTNGEGLRVIPRKTPVQLLPEIQSARDPFVYGVFPVDTSEIVIATREQVYSVSKDFTLTKLTQGNKEIHPASIRDITEINGRRIIGTYEIDQKKEIFRSKNEIGNSVWGAKFLKRPHGRLMIAGWGNIEIYADSFLSRFYDREDAYCLLSNLNFGRCTGLLPSDSGVYLASLTGLYWFNDSTMNFGRFSLEPGVESSFMGMVRSSKGEYYAASKRKIFKLHAEGAWKEVEVETNDLNRNITALVIDENDYIWIGTERGLVVLKGSETIVLDKETGLPGNTVNALGYEPSEHRIWAGTNNGVAVVNAHLLFERFNFPVTIDSVMTVRGSGYTTLQGLMLGHNENTLTAVLHLKDYYGFYKPKYRYRNPLNNKWSDLDGNEIHFATLPSGKYDLEVQARIPGMEWSDSNTYKFTILAPFWTRRPFQFLVILAAFVLGWLVYHIKQRQDRKALKLSEQMNQLELESVYASLNPHFIFNTINSIQHYLLPSNNVRAINYVANFAKLIRQNMNSANRHVIRLSEELERIKLYVDLEKERLNGMLQLEVEVEEAVLNTEIPSMILQPLVENAIWHGVSALSNGGRIRLVISTRGNDLCISVEDNGLGFPGMKESEEERFVHGLDLIRKRIKLSNRENSLNISEISDAEGKVCGVRAQILLKGKHNLKR